MIKRLLLLAVLGLCSWLALMPMTAWAQGVTNTDAMMLETCTQVKALAVQVLSEDDMERLNAMSDLECEHRLAGRTYSELKEYLISDEFEDEFAQDMTVVSIPEPTVEEDMADAIPDAPATFVTVYEYDADGNVIGHTHVHVGAIGQHGYGGWLQHRWNSAGIGYSHIVSWVDLHHWERQYYKYRRLGGAYHNGSEYQEWYIFYRNVSISGQLGDESEEEEGEYGNFQFKVRYERKYCDNQDETGCGNWRRLTRKKKCYASSHKYGGTGCYIVE